MASSAVVFTVNRRKAVLVAPAKPTPHELKLLSDIDDQPRLRHKLTSVFFYRHGNNPFLGNHSDPVQVVRDALAKTLVFYYPLAGRIRESRPNGGKLAVECNAEGVPFIEADADVRLDQFGDDELVPPFPCMEEFMRDDDYGGNGDILDQPPISIQVTRLKCGGFVVALCFFHVIADASGTIQFLTAVAEIARGSDMPKIMPVWARHLLSARCRPRITHNHPEFDKEEGDSIEPAIDDSDLVQRSFFFGYGECLAGLRSHLPDHLRSSSNFEVLTAWLWRCRSLALYSGPNNIVRVRFPYNTRGKIRPLLPTGYYGNATAIIQAQSTLGELTSSHFSYAVELVKKAKASVTDGYLQSVADLMVLRGRPPTAGGRTFVVSDVSKAGFDEVNFGWGEPACVVPSMSRRAGLVGGGPSPYTRHRNKKGEDGILVPITLPKRAMERFTEEIWGAAKGPVMGEGGSRIKSNM